MIRMPESCKPVKSLHLRYTIDDNADPVLIQVDEFPEMQWKPRSAELDDFIAKLRLTAKEYQEIVVFVREEGKKRWNSIDTITSEDIDENYPDIFSKINWYVDGGLGFYGYGMR